LEFSNNANKPNIERSKDRNFDRFAYSCN